MSEKEDTRGIKLNYKSKRKKDLNYKEKKTTVDLIDL